MFHPTSNRLSSFLEVSALFISLARSGGVQYKAGYLRLETSGNNPGPGRKATSRRDRKQSRWCAVRESCLVILEEPGEVCCISPSQYASHQCDRSLFWMPSSWIRALRSNVRFVTIAKASISFGQNPRIGSFTPQDARTKMLYLTRQMPTALWSRVLSLANSVELSMFVTD